MKAKSTDKFKAINKDATVGNRPHVVMVINPPLPKKGSASVSITASSKKKKKCSGCSRKRRSG